MDDLAEFARRLRARLMRRGEAAHDAEDIVQEALLRFEEASNRAQVLHPKAFISRIATNLAIDAHRGRRRTRPIDQYDLADFSPDPGEVLEARERLRRLNAGLSKLSERSRRILLAQRLQGLSHAEIARQEGISVSGVEKQMARSLLFLIEWMNCER